MDGTDGHQQLRESRVLQQIAARTDPQGLEHVASVAVHREEDHAHPGCAFGERPRDFEATASGHGDVEHHDVGPRLEGEGESAVAVLGLADEFEIGLGAEQRAHAVAEDAMVVGEQDPDAHDTLPWQRTLKRTRVPRPTAVSSSIRPPSWCRRSSIE